MNYSTLFTNTDFGRRSPGNTPIDMVCIRVYDCTMKRTNVHLEEKQLNALKAISQKTGAPVNALIRRAVDAFLRNNRG